MNDYKNSFKDEINKTYKSCGCILIIELDFINNILNDKYIQFCNKHKKNKSTKFKDSQVSYINFGKYKNKSFDYVFQKDKLYCYNLALWNFKNKEYKNPNINQFILFIKNKISINNSYETINNSNISTNILNRKI